MNKVNCTVIDGVGDLMNNVLFGIFSLMLYDTLV